MHYYKKDIADYHKKAGRLSMLQHGAYTLLMDSCYDRECFPTKREAIDWLWASSKEEIEAVEFVLTKFFTLEDGVYVQKRILEVLNKYQENSVTNKRIAMEREAKRKQKSTKRDEALQNGNLTKNYELGTKELRTKVKGEKSKRFVPPTLDEVISYCKERENSVDANKWLNFYKAKDWMIGKNKMKCWKSAVCTWEESKTKTPSYVPQEFPRD